MGAKQDFLADENLDEAKSVAGQLLQAFFDALEAQPGYEEIAARLKDEIIDNRGTSETLLRRAIFGEEN